MTAILLGWQKAAEQLEWIRTLAPSGCEFLVPEHSPDEGDYDADPAELVRLGREAEIIVGWNFPRQVFVESRKLKLVSSAHTGYDRYDLALFLERGVMLANAGGVNSVAVAEHALALLLALAKRIAEHDRSVRRVDWVDLTPETASVQLAGKVAAIVGLGRIGTLIAARCRAFGMKTVGVRRDVSRQVDAVDELVGADRLNSVLEAADAVILALPLNPRTRGLMGHEQFAILKPGALLVNVGRGMVVNESAVHQALTRGDLGGFAADVWWDYADASPAGYHYNVPSRLAVHRLPRVVGTPDMASNVQGMRERMIEFAMENVREFLDGKTPARAVDLRNAIGPGA